MTDPVLVIEGVTGGYGELMVLHDVSAFVREGEIVAVLGSNGAGKSTLLKTVAGLLRPVRGRISGLGRELTGLSAERVSRAGVMLVPEGRQLFSAMSVMENLLLGGYARGRGRGQRDQLARVLELFPILGERRRQVAGSLSGGQQQMLAIGRALMARPSVLLLDEPSLGLAPIVLAEVFEVLGTLRGLGVTTMIVEQNAKMTLGLADRAYVLERGRVVVQGPAAALIDDPRIQRAYLGLAGGRAA
jgi:branched-chain amino acid transport system ATP-binding protein